MARIRSRSVVLAGSGVILPFLIKDHCSGQGHDELLKLFIPVKHAVLPSAFQMTLIFFVMRSYPYHWPYHGPYPCFPPPCSSSRDAAQSANMLSHRQCPADLCWETWSGNRPPTIPCAAPAGAEVHAVNVAGHLLQEVFSGLDFRYRGLQRQIEEVSGRIGHNLLGETLQLIAVNKAEGAQIGIAAAAGVDVVAASRR